MLKNKPSIEIQGKKYTMQEPKAKMWRTWTQFDQEKREFATTDFVDKHAELIASVFPEEVTPELILEEIDLSDILKLYNECFVALTLLLTSKLASNSQQEGKSKNVPKEEDKN